MALDFLRNQIKKYKDPFLNLGTLGNYGVGKNIASAFRNNANQQPNPTQPQTSSNDQYGPYPNQIQQDQSSSSQSNSVANYYQNVLTPEIEARKERDRAYMEKQRDMQLGSAQKIADLNYQKQQQGIVDLQGMRDSYAQNATANIGLAREGTQAAQERTARDYEAEARRNQKLKQQQDIQRRNQFAALGTLESGGYSGYTGQQANADSDFLGGQQELSQDKMYALDELDRAQKTYENDALTTIDNQIAQYESQIRQLSYDQNISSEEASQLQQQLLMNFEKELSSIGDKYNDTLSQIDAKRAEILQEGGGKDLGATEVGRITDYDSSLNAIQSLGSIINSNRGIFESNTNPLSKAEKWAALQDPQNEDIQKLEADIRRVAQVVGKAMEGGVLRKEDEEKYRKMLPSITDTYDVANYKMKQVVDLLNQQRGGYVQNLSTGGYAASGYNQPTATQVGRFIVEEEN